MMLQAPPPAKDKKKQQENQQNKPNKDDDRNLPAKQLDYHMNKYDNDNLKAIHQKSLIPEYIDLDPQQQKILTQTIHQQNLQPEDIKQASFILFYLLKYPIQKFAQNHSQSNRIGQTDLLNQDSQQLQRLNAIKCPCCGMIEQKQLLSLTTDIKSLKRIGQSIYFQRGSYDKLIVLLGILFVCFGIFSGFSNFVVSNRYRNVVDGNIVGELINSYQIPTAFSFGSQQFYPIDFAKFAVIMQGWLGVIVTIIWAFVLDYYFELCLIQESFVTKERSNISDYTLLCKNMPFQYQNGRSNSNWRKKTIVELEKSVLQKINVYLSQMEVPDNKQTYGLRYNKISKINYAMPYEVDVSNLKSYKKMEELVDKIKQQKRCFKSWINELRNSYKFSKTKKERQNQYKNFNDLQKESQRILIQLVQEYRSQGWADIENKKLTRVDCFVTFQTNLSTSLLLAAQKRVRSIKQSCNKLFQKQIEWVPAAHPIDVKWNNFGMGICEKGMRMLVTVIITIAVLSGSFLVLYNLEHFKQGALANNKGSKDGFAISIILPIVLSIPTYALNFLIKILFNYMSSNWERNLTTTAEQVSLGLKIVMATLINSVLIPVLISMIMKQNIYGVEGLGDDVFYFALTNAILSVVMKFMNISFIFNRLSKLYYNLDCNKWQTSQKELNENSEYMPFELGIEYGAMMFTFLYTCLFAPLQPLIVLFSILGLFGSKLAMKFVLLRLCKRPIYCQGEIHDQLFKLAYLGPLFFAVGCFCWTDLYAVSVPHYRITTFLMFGLSLVAMLISARGSLTRILRSSTAIGAQFPQLKETEINHFLAYEKALSSHKNPQPEYQKNESDSERESVYEYQGMHFADSYEVKNPYSEQGGKADATCAIISQVERKLGLPHTI